jgi:methyltransferase (TIGR00027 family)
MNDTIIQHVSDTAFMIAAHRADETKRIDALFRDPLAEVLAGDYGNKIVENHPKKSMVQWLVTIRTVIIDEFIQYSFSQGIDTVLNLGSGLDTRPYRMDIPKAVRWIEVDYKSIISYKKTKLKKDRPKCKLEMVELDLADVDSRKKFFSGIGKRSKGLLVITEGVVPYLSVDEAAGLAVDIRKIDNIRFWIVDYSSPEMYKYRNAGSQKDYMRNVPFKFNPPDWFEFYRKHGWQINDIRYHAIEGRRLNRPIPLPVIRIIIYRIRALFMSKKRRETLGKFSGFALLEPGK